MLNRAIETRLVNNEQDLDEPSWRRFLIGQSPSISELCEIIKLIASKRVTVLISGETGTGKEVVARALHAASNRASSSLVAVNCTALPASLVESELFGHAKGAFTGAHLSRVGRFEQANRGTIFLDEIGDLPMEAQSKLLRVLQEQEFERVGSSETVRVDVRVIAASNVDLEKAVAERRFREDLYYRLNVVPIHLTPLRERRSDIPLLLNFFLEKIHVSDGGLAKEISDEAVEYLMRQAWPGNVRQLEHTVQMACALSGDRHILQANDFIARGREASQSVAIPTQNVSRPFVTVGLDGINFDKVVSDFERSLLDQALAVSGGNKARAADLLQIKRTTLLAKMKVFDEANAPARLSQPPVLDAPHTHQHVNHPAALLVEDDEPVRRLVAKTLEREGYRVLEAANRTAAIDLFDCWKSNIKIVVSSGHELANHLRKSNPALQAIVLSSRDEIHSAASHGARTELLLRPFSPGDLSTALVNLGGALSLYNIPDSQFVCA